MRIALALTLLLWAFVPAHAQGWKAGIAKVAITPNEPMWMAGFAARTHASEGKLHDIWAKALAIQDANGKQAVQFWTQTKTVTARWSAHAKSVNTTISMR